MGRKNSEFSTGSNKPNYADLGGVGTADRSSWRQVSLAEPGSNRDASDSGKKWGRGVSLVPTHTLSNYREYDRTGPDKNSASAGIISGITNDLKEKGVEGMNEPLSLMYNHEHKWGYLGEGNHRLSAAIAAGVTHVPVQVLKSSSQGMHDYKKRGVGAPLHLDNRVVETGGYMPSNMHPANFQEFEGSR
jgi:hypothetical protein